MNLKIECLLGKSSHITFYGCMQYTIAEALLVIVRIAEFQDAFLLLIQASKEIVKDVKVLLSSILTYYS